MEQGRDALHWSPRLPKARLAELYLREADGVYDEELLDEVGLSLYMRCRDILTVKQAREGRQVRCPVCDRAGRETYIRRQDGLDELLTCPACGWEIIWQDYLRSIKRRQLNAGGATQVFEGYLRRFEAARSPREKMLAIDRVIHEFHYSLKELPDQPTRPAGVNLIAGDMTSVIHFLNDLTAGNIRAEDLAENRQRWERELEALENIDWRDIMEKRRNRDRSA